MDNEIWKQIEGFEGFYEISNFGRVKSVGRPQCESCGHPSKRERIRKIGWAGAGYFMVSLARPGMGHARNKTVSVHRLVAMHFVEGRTVDRDTVNHIDGNKQNNHWKNLEWVTRSENEKHKYATGLADLDKARANVAQAAKIASANRRKERPDLFEPKTCLVCRKQFYRHHGSAKQWRKRSYCSVKCAALCPKFRQKVSEGRLRGIERKRLAFSASLSTVGLQRPELVQQISPTLH